MESKTFFLRGYKSKLKFSGFILVYSKDNMKTKYGRRFSPEDESTERNGRVIFM
jgi:hypothetical protein